MDLVILLSAGGALLALGLLAMTAAGEGVLPRVSRGRVQVWTEQGLRGAGSLRALISAPELALGRLRSLRAFCLLLAALLLLLLGRRVAGDLGLLVAGLAGLLSFPALDHAARALALAHEERSILALATSLRVLVAIARPLHALYGGLGQLLRSVLGLPFQIMTLGVTVPEEKEMAGQEEPAEGRAEMEAEIREDLEEVEPAGLAMIRRVLDFGEATARDVMVPRLDIVAVEVGAHLEQVLHLMVERGYTRIPIYEENLDRIVGILHAKDVLRALVQGRRGGDLASLARAPTFVPDSKPLVEILPEMQGRREHMNIVVDEYGGTAGLITLEDVIEEIVGEIRDEHDVGKGEAQVTPMENGAYEVDARLPLGELNALLQTDLNDTEVLTVAGLVAERLGRIPVEGDQVEVGGLCLRVLTTSGRRVSRVLVERSSTPRAP